MAHEKRRAALLKKHNLKGVNKPKRTPDHKTKSHMVLAQKGHELRLIRFGQQGVKGAGKSPKTAKDKARKKYHFLNFVFELVFSLALGCLVFLDLDLAVLDLPPFFTFDFGL